MNNDENNIKDVNTEVNTVTDAAVKDTDDGAVDLTDDEAIDLFIEGIIDEKGLKFESEQMKKDLALELKTQLLDEIDRSLVAELPDEKLDELSKTIAKNDGKIDAEVVANAVKEAGINVEDVVGATMVKFREIYLGAAEDGKE